MIDEHLVYRLMVWSMESKISFRSWIRNWMWDRQKKHHDKAPCDLLALLTNLFSLYDIFPQRLFSSWFFNRTAKQKERGIIGAPTRKIALSHARLFYLLLLIIIIYIFICSSFPLMMRNDDSIDELYHCELQRRPIVSLARSAFYILYTRCP